MFHYFSLLFITFLYVFIIFDCFSLFLFGFYSFFLVCPRLCYLNREFPINPFLGHPERKVPHLDCVVCLVRRIDLVCLVGSCGLSSGLTG